tara:strand:+ start:378 stop:1772 length:1395 start_codon:yes stop_codon:yes gene_type:complete
MLRKALRKIGGVVKKVARVVAKPFKKVMGFVGRLGWVGTLAMMFAMPYLSNFWGSMTEGFSTFVGGTGAKAGAFASGTGQATGLFAGNAASKALGYTLKSFQVAASGISKAYKSLTDLVTGAIDGVTGGGLTSFSDFVSDRFNEARNAMGFKTSEGWTPKNTTTDPVIDVEANVKNGEVKAIESVDTQQDLQSSVNVDAEVLTDQSLEKSGIGNLEDTTNEDLLRTERSLLDVESSVARQSDDYADLGTMTITGNREQLLEDLDAGVGSNFIDTDQLTKDTFNVDTSRFSTLPPIEEKLSLMGRARQAGSELWRGKYEPQPIYAQNPDGSYILGKDGRAIQTGTRDVFQPGVQDLIRNPEKIAKKGIEYGVDSARDFLDPQRVIKDEIDEITGLNPKAQVTYVENLKTIAPIAPLSPNTGILPDLPGLALSAANQMNQINNGKWYTDPSRLMQEDDYAAPGYVT